MWKQGVSLDKTEPGICEKAPGRVKKQNRAEKLAQNEITILKWLLSISAFPLGERSTELTERVRAAVFVFFELFPVLTLSGTVNGGALPL